MPNLRLIVIFLLFSLNSCRQHRLFTRLTPETTGISFVNPVVDSDSLNILDYIYFYNGGGVAIGDINNDGLADIYFSSNQGSNKLFLNKGNLQFVDITISAGVQGTGNWKTGVNMADINGDGLLDIYVCEVGKYKSFKGRNELFINNGDLTFSEKSVEYGLDAEGLNTQSSFFDFDHDGDLDMFLVNHSVHSTASFQYASKRLEPDSLSGDKLFRNDSKAGKFRFTEVTKQAGIFSSASGYGLNVVTSDFDNDSWDDIYVSNDFHENDYYYLNNHDGTFHEMNQDAFGHESRFSMGSDVADVNNDGWLDLITLDMLPAEESLLKTSPGDDPLDIYQYKLQFGYHNQYSRNCLQLNVGGGRKFSDIALSAGIAATDWSWSPLLADFDNDGIKDLFVSNGIPRRPNDLDYLKFISGKPVAEALSAGRAADRRAIGQMPSGKVSNYIFRGNEGLKYTNETTRWGLNEAGISNGAAYADLDNDGDLEIVTNNINETAGIYRNNGSQTKTHYLDITLKGLAPNTKAVGAKVILTNGNTMQLNSITTSRGFESSSSQKIHFGTGAATIIDTLQVVWPDQTTQLFTAVVADQHMVVYQQNSSNTKSLLPTAIPAQKLFTDITDSVGLTYKHRENQFTDFNYEAFIPHQVSTQGPKMAVADVNGDRLDDFYICGAANQSGSLFRQLPGEKFELTNSEVFSRDSLCEDVNALFFDADGDHDADLYVASGGNESVGRSELLLDRMYINDGKGNFVKSAFMPAVYGNKSVVCAADIDHDGDLDLFVGGRVVSRRYGNIPPSYLLLNNGHAVFTIAPDNVGKGLSHIGMVTDATWTDMDNDGWQDLVLTGEWMPLTIFRNVQGKLVNFTNEAGLQHTKGWWTCLKAVDINGDGREDLLAGNWGDNSKLIASDEYPLEMYLGDLDDNGAPDQILAAHKGGKYYSFLGKEDLEKQLPAFFRKRFPDYKSLSGLDIDEVFADSLNKMKKFTASELRSVILMNTGQNTFRISLLPAPVQWSPVFAFATGDFNNDKITDLVSVGNFYGVIPYEGRYDASYGTVLLGRPDNPFQALTPYQSGLQITGEARDIKPIRVTGKKLIYAVTRNNESILFFRPLRP